MTPENILATLILSMLPISELRGSMPMAINILQMPWPMAFTLSIVGNVLPVPFLLLFLGPLAKLFSKIKLLERSLNWVFSHTRKRSEIVEKYAALGLVIFVAIPLPLTGAWSGAIIAFLLGMKLWIALLAIAAGVFIAGAIVLALSLLGWAGAILAGLGLIILAILGFWKI